MEIADTEQDKSRIVFGESAMLKMLVALRVGLVVLAFFSPAASAYTLLFSPPTQVVGLGNQATVSVRIADVMPSGLGNYDFDILFDPSLLAFDRVVDGFGLGMAMGIGLDSSVAGRLTVSDFSFDDPNVLLASQSDGFELFALVFNTIASGTSLLYFENVTLGDVQGGASGSVLTESGSVEIVAAAQAPEPTGLLLFSTAIAVLGFGRSRGRG